MDKLESDPNNASYISMQFDTTKNGLNKTDDNSEDENRLKFGQGKRKKNDYDDDDDDTATIVDYEIIVETPDTPQLILYSYRWIVLLVYCCATAAQGISLVTTSTIVHTIENIYGIDELVVYTCQYSALLLFIPCNFISVKIIEKYGLRVCITIGATLVLVGTLIRIPVIWTNFWPVFAGQVVLSAGQAFFKNPVTKVAATWFGDKERGLATALGTISGAVGYLIGLSLPTIMISNEDKLPAYREQGHEHFSLYICVQSGIIVILATPALFLMRNKPPSPPSIIATKPRPNFSIKKGLQQLCRNRNYLILFAAFQCEYGVYQCLGGLVSSWTQPYGYNVEDNTLICVCYLISGILGSFVFGSLIDKYQCFKKLLIFICIANAITIGLCVVGLNSGMPLLEAVIVTVMGACQIPVSLVCYQLAAEITYPVNEVLSVGIINTFGQIFGIIFSLASLPLIQKNKSSLNAFIFWVCLALLGIVPSFFVKQDLRRLNMKDVRNSRYIEESDLKLQTLEERQSLISKKEIVADVSIKDLIARTDDLKSVRIQDYSGKGGMENSQKLNLGKTRLLSYRAN